MADEYSELNNLISALEVQTDDFIGELPVDLRPIDFCSTDTPAVDEPTMTMEEIDEILDSVKDLCDASAMVEQVQEMIDDAMKDKENKHPEKMACKGKIGIIEFGDDYTGGPKVDYDLWIEPDQWVDSSTMFGWVVQDEEKRIMKSIYATGHIIPKDPPENTEFKRLFPSKCKRHVLIESYVVIDETEFSQKEIDKIAEDMNNCTDLLNLMKDHMVQSTLPLILSNHELKKDHSHITECPHAAYVKGDVQYNPLVKEYFDVIDKYSKKYKEVCSNDKIKAAKGTQKGHRIIADQCMELREQMLDDIVAIYAKPRDKKLNMVGCDGETGYDNCLLLGDVDYNGNLEYDKIKNSVYGNYYVYLLSSLQTDSDSKYIKEYAELLKGIIMNRSKYEEITQATLSDEFNTLYSEHIDSKEKDGYNQLMKVTESTSNTDLETALKKLADSGLQTKIMSLAEQYLEIMNTELVTYPISNDEVIKSLKNNFNKEYNTYVDMREDNGYDVVTKAANGNSNWYNIQNIKDFMLKQSSEFMNSKSDMTYPVVMMYQRLARIANYIVDIDPEVYKKESEFTEEYTPLDLITEEAEKIKAFWEKALSEYKANPIGSMVDNIEDLGDKLSNLAEWPVPVDITIEGQPYQHWLFKNPYENKDKDVADEGDPDAENYNVEGMNIEDIQNNGFGGAGSSGNGSPGDGTGGVDTPDGASAAASMANGDAARQSANDPSLKEITVVDTEYWVKYFSLATVITLPFLADGLDIPPMMTPVLLPCIYIAFKAIHIKIFDVVLVIGLAIRGMYISPVLLTVNLSDKDVSPLLPLIAILKQVRQMFQNAISLVEMTIPNIIGLIILKLEKENQTYREQNIMYTNQLKTLEMQQVENQGLIKKHMDKLRDAAVDIRQNIFRTEDVAGK